ncbi:HAD family hydrolase [Thermosipho atlanticus]|uniref:Haloacid dehalogenase superfamily, subfamily IA, variant 1 with third motif having Dx(3-4)D or Dx(3-4)E n=1 Tax=Thermosipho atlanticus DSM 15807 TaxID=1123380 RepID=A0A1M5SPX2_9BACT|nr:HAD family hydrolase [Thermosipho atlanticus]SHH40033.1 haloacid dehalogenase superfamily, subfamily IA, variant 1 with third motif having Dx(3-4)D or Dx(3-4)E [Thermosipho atlanticus DSM 15807]
MYIFLDYDGTIVETPEQDFMKLYFLELSKKSQLPIEYIYKMVMSSIEEILKNQNPEKFLFDSFLEVIVSKDKYDREFWYNLFFDFYENEFDKVGKVMKPNKKLVEKIKTTNKKLIFASNPLFPEIATLKRIRFVGLKPENFTYIAHMENSHFAKPNPLFFKEIMEELNISPNECVMIGDTEYDKSCEKVGIKFFHISEEDKWEKIF